MATKKEDDGKSYPPSAYLVVEDEGKTSTFHLRVKSGDPPAYDKDLCGAAFAALTSNHRGQPYDGPNKAEALSKLKGIYKSQGWTLPDATMSSDDLVTVADFSQAPEPQGDVVIRRGKIFNCGEYADKDFTFNPVDLAHAVDSFSPCPVDLEHIPTVLEHKLGHVERIYPGDDGTSLMGEVHLPAWLDALLEDGERKVSATWDRATKQLRGLALVRSPRVADAALMTAAFNAGVLFPDPTFARHDTKHGQNVIQTIHDSAVIGGAVCKKPTAAMASRHENLAIQQVHDLAVTHGATCDAVSGTSTSSQNYPHFSNQSPILKRSKRMNVLDWITGKAKEEGVELDEADIKAAFSSGPDPKVAELEADLKAKEARIAEFEKAQQDHAAQFARMADERRLADAVTFAQSKVAAHRVPPAAAELLVALATRVNAADSSVTFAEGEKPTTTLLAEFIDALPDMSIFTTHNVKSEEVAALFSQMTTPGVSGKATTPTPERIKELESLTQIGRATIAAKNGKE